MSAAGHRLQQVIFPQAKKPAYKNKHMLERNDAVPALSEEGCPVICHPIMIASMPVRPACKHFIDDVPSLVHLRGQAFIMYSYEAGAT